MELSFITWNINKLRFSDINNHINDLLNSKKVDVFLFLEADNLSDNSLDVLNYEKVILSSAEPAKKIIKLFIRKNSHHKITNLTSFEEIVSRDISSTILNVEQRSFILEESQVIKRIEKVSTLELFKIENIQTGEKLLFAAIHIPSKIYQDEYDQFQSAINYKRNIVSRAGEFDNKIVVSGDFNMAPFERGMKEPMGFFAFHNQNSLKSKIELVGGTRQLSFYNPCWRLFGDYQNGSKRSGGTYYYNNASKKNKIWHLFDQVIITRNALSNFKQDSLEIIESASLLLETQSKLKKLDHIPLFFTIHL